MFSMSSGLAYVFFYVLLHFLENFPKISTIITYPFVDEWDILSIAPNTSQHSVSAPITWSTVVRPAVASIINTFQTLKDARSLTHLFLAPQWLYYMINTELMLCWQVRIQVNRKHNHYHRQSISLAPFVTLTQASQDIWKWQTEMMRPKFHL